MIIGVHMVLILGFTISKCDVQPLLKCLRFIKVNVYRCSCGCTIIGFHYVKVLCAIFIQVSKILCAIFIRVSQFH